MARYVRVRRQGRMGYLDKETGRFTLKKPTTTTSTPTPKPKPAPSSAPKVSSYKDNLKFLRDAVARQQAAGMAPRTTPGKADLVSALMIGASLGEAYRQTDRAPAVSNRGAGRATFNQGPIKRNYPVQIGTAETPKVLTEAEATQQPEAAVAQAQGANTAAAAATAPTRDQVVKSRPMNTTETIAAGKDPLHVWALANAKMIRRNNNQRQKDILAAAEAAQNKTKLKTSAEKVGWQGRTGMY